MPEVSLQSYGEEMRRLVGEGLYDRAIAMGRHVLRVYPKHLQTYRILGEACLEKGNYKEAHGLFARALACDPEDLFARVGIAVAHEKQGNLDLAIWHMERAYELAPGNVELRKELQRLYAQREGIARPRLKLTSAAVARLYARSGLWLQAIQEYRTLLEQNPDQLDIKVALAEALWHSGQRKEAVKVCEEILAEYPHCLKANLILGEINLRGEREGEGRALLQLAQDIDPENAVAQKLFGDRSPLPARVVKIIPPEEMPAPAEAPEVVLTEEEIPAEALPDWLREAPLEPLREGEPEAPAPSVPEREAEAAAAIAAGLPVAGEAEETEEGIPEWLRRIRERQKEEAAQPAAPVEEAEEAEEVPDWLARLRREQAAAEESPVAEEPTETVSEEGIPDWLKQLEAQAQVEEAAPPTEAAPEPLPDWLLGLAAEAPAEAAPEVAEVTEVEAEAVLAEAAGEAEAAPPEVVEEAAPAEVTEAEAPAEAVAEAAAPAEVAEAEAPAEAVAEAAAPAEVAEAEAPTEAIAEAAAPAEVAEAEAPAEAVAEAEAPAAVEAPAEVAEAEAPTEAIATAEAPAVEEVSPEQVLARARERRDSGDADGALDLYEQLIRNGNLLDKVLADLESGATGPLAMARTYTLIGDLCTKQERLQKALEAYRRALELVKKKSQ